MRTQKCRLKVLYEQRKLLALEKYFCSALAGYRVPSRMGDN
jgi:hypothetical protein